MKTRIKVYFFSLVITTSMLLSGCSYSRVLTTWRADDFQSGQLKKTTVIAIVQNKVIRWKLEDEFALKLRALGVQAVQSYKTFPDLKGVELEKVKAHLAQTGQDSVLVTRLIDTKKETAYVPATATSTGGGGYNNFGGYYSGSSTTVYSPGYSYDYKIFTLQSNLFATDNEKLIWTAVSEVEEPEGSVDNAVKEFVDIVFKDLKDSKVY